MHKRLLLWACILILGIWLVNTVADQFYWYSAMWWFDIPMHFAGGVFLAVLAGAVWFRQIRILDSHDIFVILLLSVLIGGLGWEYFEYIVQAVTRGPQLAHIGDSIKDVLVDLAGGFVAAYFVLGAVKRYNRAHA